MLNTEKLKLAVPRTSATGRLEIRRFLPSDFDQYASYHREPDVYRYLYQPNPSESELLVNFAAALEFKLTANEDEARLAVVGRTEKQVIGEVILKLHSLAALQGEVGYIFNPRFGGKGYATEAVRSILDIGFDDIGFHRIFARLDPANRGSVGVVERLGLRREAHLIQNDFFNGSWGDEYIYAVLADEWRVGANSVL